MSAPAAEATTASNDAATTWREVMCTEPPATMTPLQQHQFGNVWNRPGLSRRNRRLVTLVCVGWSCEQAEMEAQAYGALASGDLTVEELLEWVLHFAIYCGWPKASGMEGAIVAARARLLTERGEEVTALPMIDVMDMASTSADVRLQEGQEKFAEVNLIPAPEPRTYYTNSGILGFVFGHVWRRPGLNRRDRRMMTVPCVIVEGSRIPILNHVGTALESGDITKAEMDEVVLQISAYSGFDLGQRVQTEANAAWENLEAGGSWTDGFGR